MKFEMPLIRGKLLKRYKRFLADVELSSGECITVHCPNTGSMKNCVVPESPCWLLDSLNPKRKYRYSWELATTTCNSIAGVNTGRANKLVVEAINNGLIEKLQGYESLQTERKYGNENSRIDILLENQSSKCFVEVKSVTLAEDHRQGFFPDSVSARGSKHLRELAEVARDGHRAVLIYCVQHTGIDRVAPASHIDPCYSETFKEALVAGVEAYAYRANISTEEVRLSEQIPVSEAG